MIDWLKVAVIAVRILSIIVAILFVLALCGCAEFNQVDPTGDIPIIDISVPLPVTFPI